ncbi:helix-turn-helix domain-containing protein [Parabacteroides sp. PF5-9]|uniref:helix-turn-helix domain-containing protein n=1 Tax=Parabacteroides sp. PF5-9 TaxID=1742404 RepID=UPI0024740101|nr:helix-turn-helix domain-containing protein [Parabacteroides sp. PF5-9]MDH6357009.1 YesN/AraC family two-component response regulator [Parabacteroides sp. PF5-9]
MNNSRLAIREANNFSMNSTDFCVYFRYLYSHLQNNLSQDEILEFFKQISVDMENFILSKYQQEKKYRKSRQDELFEKFIAALRLHCSTEHSLKFYADKLFVSPQYLSKVVKDVSGKTASVWIAEFVLLEAKALLTHTNLTIQEVGFNMGFADQSSFGKFFKKNVGMSPKKFIQQLA